MLLTKPLPELVDDGVISLYSYKVIKEARLAYELDKVKVPEYIPR